MNSSPKYLWPVAAVVLGGAAAWLAQSTPSTKTSAYAAVTADPAGMQAPAGMQTPGVHGDSPATEPAGDNIHGKVLETIAVPNYTYLRIDSTLPGGEKPKDGVWAAVATADVKVGQLVTIVGANRMDKFSSATLKRTFEVIYFGALGGGQASPGKEPQPQAMQGQGPANLPPGHPDISGTAMPGAMPAPMGDNPHGAMGKSEMGTPGSDPHGSPSSGGDQVPVGKVERASGKLGHTVAEVVKDRKALNQQKVRVRGVVVKATSGVMGKTFLHLRDGSGNAKTGDHDLTVTTEQVAAVGSTMLFEGTVITDKDFGAGYSYPVLVENAQVVTE